MNQKHDCICAEWIMIDIFTIQAGVAQARKKWLLAILYQKTKY
ncbi:MAG: hypothetical protein ACJ704_09715 [Nitrososphaeraceae archaeon]